MRTPPRSRDYCVAQLRASLVGHDLVAAKPWLPRNPSQAFLVCLGAGPWRFDRRQKVQGDALQRLGTGQLQDLLEISFFPLPWQNTIGTQLCHFLRSTEQTMDDFCQGLRDHLGPHAARWALYSACGAPKGPKVLSLFCRDALGLPAFPIDRHVARRLQAWDLPVDETSMVNSCLAAGLDPCAVARTFVTLGVDGKGLDRGNPDWSHLN